MLMHRMGGLSEEHEEEVKNLRWQLSEQVSAAMLQQSTVVLIF